MARLSPLYAWEMEIYKTYLTCSSKAYALMQRTVKAL